MKPIVHIEHNEHIIIVSINPKLIMFYKDLVPFIL
jgi:hypothetical protein